MYFPLCAAAPSDAVAPFLVRMLFADAFMQAELNIIPLNRGMERDTGTT